MPYIDVLAKKTDLYIGETGTLTYELQQVIQKHLQSRLANRILRYEDIAAVLGSIEGLKADFIRRIVIPYEEKKQAENGDVWDPKLIPS